MVLQDLSNPYPLHQTRHAFPILYGEFLATLETD